MRIHVIALLLAAALITPAHARNVAVPSDDPVATLTVPDNWKRTEIDYGYSFFSPDKDVFFSVESASFKKIDAMMANNRSWMKENGIDDKVKPETADMSFGGLNGKVYQFNTTDENGPTIVEFIVLPGKNDGVIFLTVWGSEEERTKHGKAIDAIMQSVKAIQ